MSYNKPSSLDDEAIDAASNKSAPLASRDRNMMEEEEYSNNNNNNPGFFGRLFWNLSDKPSSKKVSENVNNSKRPTTSSACDVSPEPAVSSEPAFKRCRRMFADFMASDKDGNIKRPVVAAEESTIMDGRRCRRNMDDNDNCGDNINNNSIINNSNITNNNINNNNNNKKQPLLLVEEDGIHNGSSTINDNDNNNDRPDAGMELDDVRRIFELNPWSLEDHKNVLIGIQNSKFGSPKEIASDIFKSKLVPTHELLDIQIYVDVYLRAYQNAIACECEFNRSVLCSVQQLYGVPTTVAPSSRPKATSKIDSTASSLSQNVVHDHPLFVEPDFVQSPPESQTISGKIVNNDSSGPEGDVYVSTQSHMGNVNDRGISKSNNESIALPIDSENKENKNEVTFERRSAKSNPNTIRNVALESMGPATAHQQQRKTNSSSVNLFSPSGIRHLPVLPTSRSDTDNMEYIPRPTPPNNQTKGSIENTSAALESTNTTVAASASTDIAIYTEHDSISHTMKKVKTTNHHQEQEQKPTIIIDVAPCILTSPMDIVDAFTARGRPKRSADTATAMVSRKNSTTSMSDTVEGTHASTRGGYDDDDVVRGDNNNTSISHERLANETRAAEGQEYQQQQTSDTVEGTHAAARGKYDEDGSVRNEVPVNVYNNNNAFSEEPSVESPPESQTGIKKVVINAEKVNAASSTTSENVPISATMLDNCAIKTDGGHGNNLNNDIAAECTVSLLLKSGNGDSTIQAANLTKSTGARSGTRDEINDDVDIQKSNSNIEKEGNENQPRAESTTTVPPSRSRRTYRNTDVIDLTIPFQRRFSRPPDRFDPSVKPKTIDKKRHNTRFALRCATQPNLNRMVENYAEGYIKCPLCSDIITVGTNGCNVITCTNQKHRPNYHFFCYHCKAVCVGGNASCECSHRNNGEKRRIEQEKETCWGFKK